MNEEKLAAIRARADAATPGPWWASEPLCSDAVEDAAYAVCAGPDDGTEKIIVTTLGDCDQGLEIRETNRDADAVFIAHARTDVPALLDEVERLSADLAEERKTRAELGRLIGALGRAGGVPS